MEILTCRDVAVGYDGRAIAEGIDFCLHEGDYLCIIGENGAGKSTLIKTVLGLQPAISGDIRYGKKDEKKPDRREIGYLSQQTAVQKDFPASVWEIVLSGCLGGLGGRVFYGKRERDMAARMLARVHMSHLKKRCFRELSGGQQQRVLLARALCAAKRMLFLDEPVAGLDPNVTQDMYKIVEQENRAGMTIVMISHDLEATMRYASHILYLGETMFYGTKEEFADSDTGRVFLRGRSSGKHE